MTQNSVDAGDLPESAPKPADQTHMTARLGGQGITVAIMFAITFAMLLGFRLINPALNGWSQASTVLYLSSFLVFCAFGQGLVIMVRGLDLSIASTITLGGVLSATFMNGSNQNFVVLLVAILAICALVGVINGIGVSVFQVPPFIMTMAVGLIVYSLCLGSTLGTPGGYAAPALRAFMGASLLGIAAPIWMLVAFALLGTIVQSYSTFGRQLNAVGSNPLAAHLAGLPNKRIITAAYAISALCAGLTGVLLTGYADGATLRMGDAFLLPSIAAVVVGGSSILGGKGLFLGTVGGALLLTTLSTILSAAGLEEGWKTIVEGGVILVALVALRDQAFAALQDWFGPRKRSALPPPRRTAPGQSKDVNSRN